MLRDKSDDFADTWHFMERSVDDAIAAKNIAQGLINFMRRV